MNSQPAATDPGSPFAMTAPGAADCHAHIFCGTTYPFSPETVYVPHPTQTGTAAQFLAVLNAHGFTHGLLVGAGPYGPDNRCMLDAIAGSGGRFKGIALVKASVSQSELADLADRGVVGVRINLLNHGLKPLIEPGADRMLAYLKEMKLFAQIHFRRTNWSLRRRSCARPGSASCSITSGGPTSPAAFPSRGFGICLNSAGRATM